MKGYFKSPPFFITIGILLFVGIMTFIFKDHYVIDYKNPSAIKITEKWTLPRIMEEVSGISYIDEKHLACIQDEDGIIFIYNIITKKVDKKIQFAAKGDYEGVAMVNDIAYVLRSDGRLFEVNTIYSENPQVIDYETPLTEDQNIEGLCYDSEHNRLLLAIKNKEKDKKAGYKGVYAFNLNTKKLEKEPIYKLRFDAPIFKKLGDVGKAKVFRPSEIGINPITGEYYFLDAEVPKLMIVDKNWNEKFLYLLDADDFPQPEGLTFDTDGNLYISNEGEWDPANILKVAISPITHKSIEN